jgi:hypothetical protein
MHLLGCWKTRLRQDKIRQEKARQDKTRQYKARQDKTKDKKRKKLISHGKGPYYKEDDIWARTQLNTTRRGRARWEHMKMGSLTLKSLSSRHLALSLSQEWGREDKDQASQAKTTPRQYKTRQYKTS